ncbi:MAG TPA: glycosyltransferase [Rubrivivax sp.]|nr:glycosyltransferase [Rubrivivax sp.]
MLLLKMASSLNPLRLFKAPRPEPPQVSIVMPTFNQAPFIAESVASVMAQDLASLELVVADGGSTDGTPGMLAALAADHPGRLRWSSAPDAGPAQAVNAAVARARGTIVGWLNSDDLYTPGAVRRALDAFAREPGTVMVYGEAEHIDAQGRRIGSYPSAGPSAPLEKWADGCHICQPSAFFRREVFAALNGLDTTLRAAFDYDFWLRLFKAYPGRIGCVQEVQAQSRLHPGAITMRFRERVALEGMQVVHRHLGPAPPHWLLTHFAELQAEHPFEAEAVDLVPRLEQLLRQAAAWLAPQGVQALEAQIRQHRALQLIRPGFFAPLHADGWAPPVLELRVRQPAQPHAVLHLSCRHAAPRGGRLKLDISTPEGETLQLEPRRGPFEIKLPLGDQRPHARQVFRIVCRTPFVPAQCEAGSDDHRSLAFLVDDVQLQPAA